MANDKDTRNFFRNAAIICFATSVALKATAKVKENEYQKKQQALAKKQQEFAKEQQALAEKKTKERIILRDQLRADTKNKYTFSMRDLDE